MAGRKQVTPPEPEIVPDAWRDGPWNEIAGFVLFGLGLFLLLALISYDSSDPSWNTTGTNPVARNWIGPLGAKISDFLFQSIGLASLIVPISLFYAGWYQWQDVRPTVPKPKALGILLMILAITGVLTMIGSEQPKTFYLGGAIGRWLVYGRGIGLAEWVGAIGATFALLIIFIIGLLIGTDFSIISTIIKISEAEQQPGLINSFTGSFRTWRGGRETDLSGAAGQSGLIAADSETAGSRRPPAPAIRRQQPVTPAGRNSGSTAEFPDGFVDADEIETAELLTTDRSASGPGKSLNGQRRRKIALSDDPNEVIEEDDVPFDEAEDTVGAGQRSVDDMVSTASVKRTDLSEEKGKPAQKSTVGKIATAIARIAADYKLPGSEMLTPPAPRSEMEETELLERARQLAEKCAEFNVSGQVKQISPGPVVTTFEFKPDPGVKYSRVTSLVDDLCLALRAESIRIDRIPGKSTVGIEVPNTNREIIRLREVIESKKFRESESKLTIALGKTIDGSNYVADLARMPHLLIAGATGAGKSVLINGILVSLLYKASPDEVKMIMVDPKRLELGLYADIPHLLTPIVTDPKRASNALRWAVSEMENRYKHLAAFGVRNIDQYNTEVCSKYDPKKDDDSAENPKPLPYIVVVIDELADLMMVSARDVEESITRLAQMARAVGIHLVLATQRPSVDVITGLIKANFPSRISFRVSSKVDSRTIIDTNGAEQLLGQGDMLFLPPGTSRLVRVHGSYVDEKEIKRICDFVRTQGNPAYNEKVVMSEKETEGADGGDFPRDDKYDDALRIVLQYRKASTSLLQRNLRIGYGRAASIIDMMFREGIVGPEDGSKPRQVLAPADFLERLDQMREEKDL